MRGLIVGKFAPLHLGHNKLIEYGLTKVDDLAVYVVDSPVDGFTVPAATRAEWIRQIHPSVTAGVMPDIRADDRSDLWAEYTKTFLGYTPDVVISSEEYGYDWADALNCVHIPFDLDRNAVPISATMVRSNPKRWLKYLHPIVRAHYITRIAVVGAESTGTTTLAKALASHYGEPYVPEYGRVRDERAVKYTGKTCAWEYEEFYYTAVMQQLYEDKAGLEADELIICDTEAWATYLWQDRYGHEVNFELADLAESRHYDLYIITDYRDVDEEDDGFRFEMHRRPEMHESFVNLMRIHNNNYIVASGSHEQRMQQALYEIDGVLAKQAA